MDNFYSIKRDPAIETADFLKSYCVSATLEFKEIFDGGETLSKHKLVLQKFDTKHFTFDPLQGGEVQLDAKNHYKQAFLDIVTLKDIGDRGLDFKAVFGNKNISRNDSVPTLPPHRMSDTPVTMATDSVFMIREDMDVDADPPLSSTAAPLSPSGSDDLVSDLRMRLSSLERIFSLGENANAANTATNENTTAANTTDTTTNEKATTATTATNPKPKSSPEAKVENPESNGNVIEEEEIETFCSEIKGTATINIPKYTGAHSLPVETWAKVAKRALKAGNATKEVGLAKLSVSLSEPHFSIFDKIVIADEREATNLSLDAILDSFVLKVSSSNDSTALTLFNTRRQRVNETAWAFGMELQRLSTACFRGIDQNTVDKLVLHKFLDGLSQPLKSNVKISMPSTLQQAMTNSLVLEPTAVHRDISTNVIKQQPRPAYKKELKPDLYKGKLPSFRAYNPNRNNRHEDRNRRSNDQMNDNESNLMPNYMNRGSDRVSAIDLSKVICYSCGKSGHYKRFCPANQSANRNHQSANYSANSKN